MGMFLYVGSIAAGTYDQLWDYRTAPPTANPDRGLSYLENPVPLYSAGMRTDSMDANAAFFIRALMNANAGGEKMIRLPDGIYDLGPLALTTTTILNKH